MCQASPSLHTPSAADLPLTSPAYDTPITPATHPPPAKPRPPFTLVGLLVNAYAMACGFLICANFTSSAIIAATMWLLFSRLCPPLFHASRVLLVRWGWSAAVVLQRLANVRPIVTGDSEVLGKGDYLPLDPRRYLDIFSSRLPRAMCFMNHLSWADSFVMASWLLTRNAGNGDSCWPIWKWFIKTPLGWTAYMGGCPFLGYGKETDLRTVKWSATSFFKRWFTKYYIFPEGAIYRDEMKQKSHEYARRNKLPMLEHCLHPKTAAFYESGLLLRDQGMKELVCITIAYGRGTHWDKNPYDLLELVRPHMSKPVDVHFHVRRFSFEDVDWQDEASVKAWLTDRFREKDQILDQFYQGKGPMTENPRVEAPSALLLMQELAIWSAVQAGFYVGVFKLVRLAVSAVLQG